MGLLKKIISWFIPEQKQTKQQTGTNLTKASSDHHVKVIYGTRKTEGTIVFMNTTNPVDDDDVKNDLLHIIIVWCEGGVESVDDILLNDISITDSKFNAKDGGRWAYAYNFTNGMAGLSSPHLRDAGWDGAAKNHRLDGLCCTYLRLEWSIGDNAPFTGVPDATAIIKGRKVKNLETGRTEYSENPAYCTVDYLTNPIFGKGLKLSEYDLDSFKRGGQIADTHVPKFQGSDETQPLFSCNVVIDTGQSVLDNTEILSKSMRALMPIINGKLTLLIEQDDEPTPYALSENDFDGKLKYDEGSKDKRYNRVIVEYIDKELSFSEQDAVYPEPDSELADQWLAEDNGVLLEYRFKVSSCTNYYEARQMARIIAMISRESLSFSVTVSPIGLRYTVGDVIPINHKKLGWVNKPFRLVNKTDLPNGQFTFNLREHQPYIYNWLSDVVRPPIPDTSLPNPRNVAAPANFSSTLLNDGHVQIAWESDYSHFEIQIYKDNALILSTTSATPAFVITALDAGNYEMDVRAASKIGFHSQWVTFGFSVALPAEPSVNIDAVTYNTITLSANVTGASLGTTFEWQFLGPTSEPIANPNTASGYNYIYTGLVPDTEYSFKVRTKNLSGVSPWVDVRAKTSLADLLDYIDDIPLTKLSEDAQTLIDDINTQVDRLRPDTEDNIPEVLARTVNELNLERQARTDIEQGVFDLSAEYTNWRQNYEQRQLGNERLIDAAVYIDPDNGTIVNRAFAYTDEAFNEANVLIDGVNARIDLQANRITGTNDRLTQAEATLTVQAGQINQRATFTEVRTEIAGAIEALTPAYSWHFNHNTEGFSGDVAHNAQGFLVATGLVNSAPITYEAEENPMLRLRVRKHADTQWQGNLYFGADEFLVNVLEPESENWETTQIDLTGIEGYTGTITALKIDLGHVDIDFIEIGKRGANDLALNDITTRATILENDIDAATGVMAQYATTAWVNDLGYQTQSNVNEIIDTFNTTYQISATLQEFNDNGTLEKANNAQQFINGAEAYITSQITAFNAAEGGVDAQFANVEQTLDALNGTISENIVQVQGLELDLQEANLNDVIAAANQFIQGNELAEQGLKLAVAQTKLTANTTTLESVAAETLELAAQYNSNLGLITTLNQAFADEQQATVERDERYQATFENVTARFSDVTRAISTINEANTVRDQEFESFVADTVSSFDEVAETFASQNQAFTTLEQTLTSKINTETDNAKNEAIATAQEYTRTAVGYCVDAEGNITSENDAVQCVSAGGSWVDGPLAEYIANMQISDGDQTASIKQLRQLFTTVDGKLVARGGWTLDNNGRVTGVAGYNDGEIANLDLVGDVIRQGVMVGETFVPTSYVDNSDPMNPVHTFKGKMILGDDYEVQSEEDIRAKDGSTIRDEYQYSVDGQNDWHYILETGDLYRRERVLENDQPVTQWSEAARLSGYDGETASAPTITTNPDGSYTIQSGNDSITIRDGENAPIPTVNDNGDGTHTITDGAGNTITVANGEDGYTPVKGTDYFDGKDGSYNSLIFTTGTTTPPTPTGGSFDGENEVIPAGYQDAPYFEEGKITYVSKAMYKNVATAWAHSGWSKPAEYIIKGADGQTPTVTTNADGSYTISNGVDSVIIRDGENAPIPTVIDNGDGTHTITDGAGHSIVVNDGEDGATPVKGVDYFDGLNGNYNSLVFKTGTSKPAAPTGGSFNGTNETIPAGYKDAPYFESGKTTYVSKAVYIHDGTNWVNQGWSDPAPYSVQGEDGETPTITTNGDGSYTISNSSGSITVRDGVDAPIPTVTDNGNGTHTITDGRGNQIVVRDGENGYTPVKGTDYFDGLNGNYNSLIFQAAEAWPDDPTGGSFDGVNESFPAGWSDAPYFIDGRITYVSKAVYRHTGTEWVNDGWTAPEVYTLQGEKGADGEAAFTNLIRPSDHWVVGTQGNQGIYDDYSPAENNTIINMMGPMGVIEPAWRCSGIDVHQAGGFKASIDVADTSKGLQVSIWINDSANNDHRLYIGSAGANTLGGEYNSNPYFKPSFGLAKPNKWYLFVAVLHPEGYQGGETGRSGVYDPETGEKVGAVTEFALTSANSQLLRAFRYSAETADTYTYFARPRVEVINGEEMTLAALMGRVSKDGESAINFYTSAGEFAREGINYVKKTVSGWNTGISSKEKFVHATASVRVDSNSNVMMGLSTSSCLGDYRNLGHAIYSSDGQLRIYESGINKTNWLTSSSGANRLSVVWDGINVKYYKDAELLYTSTTKPTAPVLFDLAVYDYDGVFAEPLFAATGHGGNRGSVEVQVPTSTGAWSDTTASNAVPNGIPVEHDRVTIYKSSAPAVQTIKRYNGSAWVSYTLHVHGSALIEDTLDANVIRAGTTMTSPRIVGGEIITNTGSGVRGEYFDDGTYLVWIGSGSKTDSNALFFIRRDGTGFIKGSFFSGQMMETKYAQGTTSASLSHKSAGHDVDITLNTSGSGTAITSSSSTPVGTSTYSRPYTIKRGSTTIDSGTVIITRVVTYEQGEYLILDHYSFSTTLVDTGTSSATYTYSVSIGSIALSSSNQKISIKTQENLLNS